MMELCLLAVDDESLALSDLTAALQAAEPAAAVHAYTDPTKALEAVRTGEILPDIAFLDIQMRGWTGLDLALELKRRSRRSRSFLLRLIRSMRWNPIPSMRAAT